MLGLEDWGNGGMGKWGGGRQFLKTGTKHQREVSFGQVLNACGEKWKCFLNVASGNDIPGWHPFLLFCRKFLISFLETV